MSDPTALMAAIEDAEDAFSHAIGEPRFEPKIDASSQAPAGKVEIQKACRLLDLNQHIEGHEYYGAMLEHAFIAVEQTFQGYLLAVTGTEPRELRDHETPYERAKGHVPLDNATIESIQWLYDDRRNDHYYDTTVTTAAQAEAMHSVASRVHSHIVGFSDEIGRYCNCPPSE